MRKENKIILACVACALLVLSTFVAIACVDLPDRGPGELIVQNQNAKPNGSATNEEPVGLNKVDPDTLVIPEPLEPEEDEPTEDEKTTTTTQTTTQATSTTPTADAPESEIKALKRGDKSSEVKELQNRLRELGFLTDAADGIYGKNTEKAVKIFQRDSGLEQTGVADLDTQDNLFSNAAITAPKTENHEDVESPNYNTDYYIIVYNDNCSVLVLGKDDYGKYNKVVKNFACSVGKGPDDDTTPPGLYAVEVRYDWRAMFGGVYAQYAVRFFGNYLFHSVPYYTQNPNDLEMEEFEKLGTPASLGCVRLCTRDAKWIYDNAANGTQVRVIAGKEGPTNTESIPALNYDAEYYGWDPTDPNPNNPYNK